VGGFQQALPFLYLQPQDTLTVNDLATHQDQRSLISLRRDEIDDHAIEGFVIGASDELVLLQYVYDFHLDGLMVLAVSDITEVRCTATNRFQRNLLESEGLVERVPFGLSIDLQNWRSAIANLASRYPLLILECERQDEPDFVIGRVMDAAPNEVRFECFSGAANWDKKPVKLSYKDITSCQAGSNYANVYQRHFERKAG
jgi:hypothetical protein